MVGIVAGGALTIDTAIPVIMGANIGTSVTNTIVSLPQIRRSSEFQRAFAAATVHNFFNILSVIAIFPLQVTTNFIGIVSYEFATMFQNIGGLEILSPVKVLTEPLIHILKDTFVLSP